MAAVVAPNGIRRRQATHALHQNRIRRCNVLASSWTIDTWVGLFRNAICSTGIASSSRPHPMSARQIVICFDRVGAQRRGTAQQQDSCAEVFVLHQQLAEQAQRINMMRSLRQQRTTERLLRRPRYRRVAARGRVADRC